MRRLTYADEAIADLDAVRAWLTQPGSGTAARRRLSAIHAEVKSLKQDPCRWPVGEHPGVRELQAPAGYCVLYEVIPDTGRSATAGHIIVLRIYGPGQDRRAFRQTG